MEKQHDNPFEFTKAVILLPLFFVLTLWLVFWYELHFHYSLSHFGVFPREVFGLKGILFSPFLHGDMEHLANNSIALLVLLPILRYFYKEQSFVVLFLGILFSGLGTWLLGRPSYHIGASGLIYTLVSFIFFKGIFTKYYRLVALSFTIVILYGGSVWYIFPNVKEGISWEGKWGVDLSVDYVDEKGNFNPPPKPEEVIKEYFNSSVKVVYEFLGGKK